METRNEIFKGNVKVLGSSQSETTHIQMVSRPVCLSLWLSGRYQHRTQSHSCTCVPWTSFVTCVCLCVCVLRKHRHAGVQTACERWDLPTGRPPCPLAISVLCRPRCQLCNDSRDTDHSLFVVCISHHWASVPEGQVHSIITGVQNREQRRHAFEVKKKKNNNKNNTALCVRRRAVIECVRSLSRLWSGESSTDISV